MKAVALIIILTNSLAHIVLSNPPSYVEIKRNENMIHISRTKHDHVEVPKKPNELKKIEANGYNKNIVTDDKLTMKIDEPIIDKNVMSTGTNTGSAPCCNGVTCFPCPYPMPMAYPVPVPQIPQIPIVVPAQTFYEPVIHDHPPLYKIKEIIKKGRKKKKRYSASDCSDASESGDGNRSVDYYDGAFHVEGPQIKF